MNRWIPLMSAAVAAFLLIVVAAALIIGEDDEGADDDGQAPDDEETGQETNNETDEESAPDGETDSGQEGGEGGDGASIEVTEAWIDEGDCLFEESTVNETCHRLRVLVHAGDRDFGVGLSLWRADDSQGDEHVASWVVSPDPVPAGTSRSITVAFDMEEDVRLVELRHSGPAAAELAASVPGY